nr:hypothetical protein [Tanacetum cinerariifolium]
ESDEEETRQEEEESFDSIPRTPEESEEESNNEEDQDLRLSEEARIQEEEDADELYRDVNINQGRGLQVTQNVKDTHVTLTPVNPDGVESIFTTASSPIVSLQTPTPIMTPSTIATITTSNEAPIPPQIIPSIILENLPTFNTAFRFEERLRSLETSFSEYRQTNQFADAVSAIPENDEFLHNIDENMKKIIKGQVKNQVKEQVSRILPRIEESVNATLEAEVLTRSSQSSRTSYAIAADFSEMELKKILIEKMEGNKSIQRSDEQRNLYQAESAYAEEPVQTTCQMKEPPHPPRRPPSPDRAWNTTLLAAQGDAQSWISDLARQTNVRSSFNELIDTPIDFSNFIMHRLNVDTLTPDLLAGLTYELMRGSCTSSTELEYHLEEVYKATTDQLDWVNPEGQQYPHNLLQPLPLIPDNRGRRVISFEHFINNDLEYLRGVNRESARDVYSKRRIIAITELQIMEWHDYKHLDWTSVRRDDDQIYKFKEGDFKRLRLQDIEDMLLLLVQGNLSNLTVEERPAFNVSLTMFTRSIVIKRRVEDHQLGVESYQKKLNLTKPDTYRPDLRRREAYTAHSNPRGFIYQNKDKKNRMMQIDELHKFSDGCELLQALRELLADFPIRMQYLPTTIWIRGDKERAAAMI